MNCDNANPRISVTRPLIQKTVTVHKKRVTRLTLGKFTHSGTRSLQKSAKSFEQVQSFSKLLDRKEKMVVRSTSSSTLPVVLFMESVGVGQCSNEKTQWSQNRSVREAVESKLCEKVSIDSAIYVSTVTVHTVTCGCA